MSPDKASKIWRLALDSWRRGCGAVLLYVLESKGSSPGRQGFFMVVNEEGMMEGSIGGGIMEHKFTELAIQRMREPLRAVRRQMHDDGDGAGKDRSGMICSGEQTIFVYRIRDEDHVAIEALTASLEALESGILRLSDEGIGFRREGAMVAGAAAQASVLEAADFVFWPDGEWFYEERTGFRQRLYIIGAGHCSLALSRIMRMMDFYITVVDHRPELSTLVRNDSAHERMIIADYHELAGMSWGGPRDYVIIMTLGYRTDDRAVRALLGKDWRYIGLLGSKAKVGRMLETYRAEGVEERLLERMHTPAGLAIHSREPEEIAVSIAAEIIGVKNAG